MRAPRAVVVLVLVLGVEMVAAQPPPSEEENRARALELFGESAEHYKRGEFEMAAELLREAYGLHAEPLLLYNLARALEGLGDFAGAIENYERYLAEATEVDDRPAIERRVTTLKEQVARQARPVDDVADRPTPTPPPPPPPPPVREVETPPRSPRMAPWFVAGAGAAVAGAGGVFGYLAGAKEDDARDAPVQEDAARLLDDARRDAKIANILFIAGGAVAVGGITWGIIARARGGTAAPTVAGGTLQVAPAWVGITWELR